MSLAYIHFQTFLRVENKAWIPSALRWFPDKSFISDYVGEALLMFLFEIYHCEIDMYHFSHYIEESIQKDEVTFLRHIGSRT